MADITAYLQFIYSGAGSPTAQQWRELLHGTESVDGLLTQPMTASIATAARAVQPRQPRYELSFTSQSPDGKRWLGQVTIVGDATKDSVPRSEDRQILRAFYEDAGGEQPAGGWDDLTIRDVLLQILDYWSDQYSVTGNAATRLAGVLQAEARTVAAALGYSAAQQANLSVETLYLGDPDDAAMAARTLKTDPAWQV